MSALARTLGARLALQLAAAVMATALLFGLVYQVMLQRASVTEAVRLQRQQQDAIAAGLVRVFADLEARAGALAWQIAQGTLDAVQLDMQLRAQVLHDPDITAMAVFLEADNPVAPGSRIALSAAYDGAGISVRDFLATGYEFADRDWYRRTLASESGYWSDLFFNDAAGGLDTVNFDVPLENASGRRIGMLGVSVSLDRIAFVARELGLSMEHPFLLLDGAGRVLVSWEPSLERAYTIEEALQRAPRSLHWMTGGRLGGAARDERYDESEARGWRSYTPLRPPGWHLLAAVSDRAAWSERRGEARRAALWGAGIALTIAALGLFALIARMRPLRALLASTSRLAFGDDARAWRDHYQDVELEQAAHGLRTGAQALRSAREDLLDEQAENAILRERNSLFERMHRVQQPDDRTFFGSRFECAWQARLEAASPGDGLFYGFLTTCADSCHFFLGVPVDRDVPSLLSMGQICGSLPGLLRAHPQPARAMIALAEWIALERPQSMQFHLLLGRMDLASGSVEYAAAGPLALLVLRADGAVEPAAMTHAQPLARDTGAEPEPCTLVLGAGDRMLLACSARGAASAESASAALASLAQRPDGELLDAAMTWLHGAGASSHDTPGDCGLVLARLRYRD
ncbi:MAG: SpoIIE family protein phosphatase [Xanthomonadales bacterium]|nr:SpoIIE family protein phosphatase [Xanthomonadales bacterium]